MIEPTPRPRRKRKPKPITTGDQIARGYRARRELDETEDAFLAVREELLEAIAASTPNEAEGRERLYMAVWALGRVRSMLIETMNDGIQAEAMQKTAAEIAGGLPN